MNRPSPYDGVLQEWDTRGLRRTLAMGRGVDFCTNDALGLASDKRVAEAAAQAASVEGAGSKAARLLGGHRALHDALEREAAKWLGTERALLFPSGYQANVGVLSTLAEAGDVVASDAKNHASIIDGLRLSRAQTAIFAHNDPDALDRALSHATSAKRRLIAVESVYSMDGTLAPLNDYARLAERHDAWLIVDEAHAVGLYGPQGQGRVATMDDASRVVARIVTGGKALGVAGALVAAAGPVVDVLVNRARSFVFTTAPPPPVVAALRKAVDIVASDDALRLRPHAKAARLRGVLHGAGLKTPGTSPIVFVHIGSAEAAARVAALVQKDGFDVRAVRPPTVAPGQSGLRLVVHAGHSDSVIDRLAASLLLACQGERHPAPEVASRPAICVVGTDTGVGKTVVSAAIVRALAARGDDVRYWKPVQTGLDADTEVVAALSGMPTRHLPVVSLPRPASVDQAAKHAGVPVAVDDVSKACHRAREASPHATFVFETAGGLLVPFNDTEDQSALVRALDASVVLVARSGLGTLNHSLLTLEALRRRGIDVRALVLVGEPHADNVATLRSRFTALPIWALPTLDPLDAQSLDAWARANDVAAVL